MFVGPASLRMRQWSPEASPVVPSCERSISDAYFLRANWRGGTEDHLQLALAKLRHAAHRLGQAVEASVLALVDSVVQGLCRLCSKLQQFGKKSSAQTNLTTVLALDSLLQCLL